MLFHKKPALANAERNNPIIENELHLSPEEKAFQRKLDVYHFIISIVCMALVMLTLHINFRIMTVPTGSMYPTLQVHECLMVKTTNNPLRSLDYGDITTFNFVLDGQEEILVKRLIGKPGDTIEVTAYHVIRNGEEVFEDYRLQGMTVLTQEPITLDENEYFFMGDNWNNSGDSRVFGAVSGDDIIGKVFFHFNLFHDEECERFLNDTPYEFRHPDFAG